jgi:hypothetical protein
MSPLAAQPTKDQITSLAICLTVLDLAIKLQIVGQTFEPQSQSQVVVLKNTLSTYKQVISHNMTADLQFQIAQTYMILKQEFVNSIMALDNQELHEFATNLTIILDQCVDAASYQSGTTK